MATTTTNFNFPIPQSTDLVKDGATAIAALGTSVDTQFVDLKGGTTGQVLAKASNTDLDYSWTTPEIGDITGITASSPLTGGGTSGAVTVGILDATTSNKGAVQLSTSTSSTSTSLAATASAVKEAYDPAFTNNYYAAKNKLINSNFANWQRGTSLTYTSSGLNYLADRFFSWTIGTLNVTVSQQSFTPGTAPVAGYEGQYFMRNAVTSLSGQTIQAVGQRIEDVRTLAGQTATFSFWAKADASRTYTTRFIQNFGSGGSSEVSISGGSHSVTTSWQRFSVTVSIASVSGKTIGTSSYLQPLIDGPANTANTLDTWGWQLEAGSTATPFQTASGSIQSELAMCQRYYEKSYDLSTAPGSSSTPGSVYLTQGSDGGNNSAYALRFKVEKRNASWSAAYYTTAGTATVWTYLRLTVGATSATVTTDLQSTSGARIYLNTGAAWTNNTIQGHWVVDNEL